MSSCTCSRPFVCRCRTTACAGCLTTSPAEVGQEVHVVFADFEQAIGRIKARRDERRRKKKGKEEVMYSTDAVGVFSNYVILPGSPAYRRWNMMQLAVSVYYVISVPYICAFLRFNQPPLTVLVPMYVADALSWLNILRKFFTGFVNEHSLVVRALDKIREHYLKNDFVYDVSSVLPLDIVVFLTSSSNRFQPVTWLRMLRMRRFRDIMRKLKDVSDDLRTSPMSAELTSLAVFVFSTFHLCACMWYYLTAPDRSGFEGHDNWVTHAGREEQAYGSYYLCSDEGPKRFWIICELSVNEYMLCLYWVVGQLTTIGAGDLPQMTRSDGSPCFWC